MMKREIHLPSKYSWVDLSDDLYRDTLDKVLNTKKNLYINGAGGVGKSVMIELAYNLLPGKTMVLASTGIAAANLADKKIPAVTIHRGLRIPPMNIFDTNTKIDGDTLNLLSKIDTIIIEEVSMVSASLFDQIIKIIHEAEKWRYGEIRLLLFGDILQFAPVVAKNDPTLEKYYKNKYNGNVYFFNSIGFEHKHFETINLERVYRQKSEELQENLMKIRLNIEDDEVLEFFNRKVEPITSFLSKHRNCLVICTTKKREQALNDKYGIPDKNAPHKFFKAEISGEFKRNELSVVEDEVTIYVGQQIICLCNDSDAGYQNGTLARVEAITEETVIARKSNNEQIKIGIHTWDQYEYKYNEETDEVETNIVGSFKQIGCKPAFAVTFHKAQGMTLESVYLDLQSWWVPKSGIYVGLSRCKTLDGIGISREITHEDVSVESEAMDFFLENVYDGE